MSAWQGGRPLEIISTGMVTSVGQTAPSTCAAIRAKVTNPIESHFIDAVGEPLISHAVELERPWRGRTKLARMAAMAIEECLEPFPLSEWSRIPVLFGVAEAARPGRYEGLDDYLLQEVGGLLGAKFAESSAVVPYGRVSVGVALRLARQLVFEQHAPAVVIAAADSLLTWPTLRDFEERERLLTARNSNGFIPGEAAAAVLVGPPSAAGLVVHGIGLTRESAYLDSEIPLRADGLTAAIQSALSDAQCVLHDLDFRISDISGEQYYFKEAALALSRTLRQRKESFDIWHPAECVGEVGAAIGPIMLAVADSACRQSYAAGPGILFHGANDTGERLALVARYAVS